MNKHYLEVFCFIKDTQKGTTLRRVDSNGNTRFYAQITLPHISYFTRISKYEYDQIDNCYNATKDCMTTFTKNGRLYQEHYVRFKG